MAIWLGAREEFTDNRFQLLFIYIDIDKRSKFIGSITHNHADIQLLIFIHYAGQNDFEGLTVSHRHEGKITFR